LGLLYLTKTQARKVTLSKGVNLNNEVMKFYKNTTCNKTTVCLRFFRGISRYNLCALIARLFFYQHLVALPVEAQQK
jgi:hypothetical protein